MVTRVLLIRHAQTDANAAGRSQGHRDVSLNARGRQQADALARGLATEPLAAVVCSDSSRSVDTATAIAAAHSLTPRLDARLRELDQGELDGLTSEEMQARCPDFLIRWRSEDPGPLRIPGGETLAEAQSRMVDAVTAIAREYPGSTVAVVSHNLATRALLCHALHVPLSAFRALRHDVASLAEVEVRLDDWWTVVRMNEQCHLLAEPPLTVGTVLEGEAATPEAGRAAERA